MLNNGIKSPLINNISLYNIGIKPPPYRSVMSGNHSLLNNEVKAHYSVFVPQMLNNPLDKYQMSKVNSELINLSDEWSLLIDDNIFKKKLL